MKKVVTITKTMKVLKVRDIVQDLESDRTDEEILEKYRLTWTQLSKIYSKLYHRGHIDIEDLFRRAQMRGAKDASHIPLVKLDEPKRVYSCIHCGFRSEAHFSTCPRCAGINLRRLKKIAPALLSAGRSSREPSAEDPAAIHSSPAPAAN